jgi:hypothetical protein
MDMILKPVVEAGRIMFSGVATIYALVLLAIASFSVQFADESDVLSSKSDVNAWDVVLAMGIAATGVLFLLGALAPWTQVVPKRRWLIGATLFGVTAFSVVWALNALGMTDIYA